MSSTYAHYQGPSSIPTDYAIVSRLNAHHSGVSLNDPEGDASETAPGRRPARPTIAPSAAAASHYPEPASPSSSSSSVTAEAPIRVSERTPLLSNPPIPRIEEPVDREEGDESMSALAMFKEELLILTKYSLPVFGTHLLEYSLVIVSVISIGHISTTALAAISLGSMTASVTGFSIIQGLASALDTVLPSAWTSPQPHLVGVWAQRMTVVMMAALVPMFLIWFNAERLLIALKQDPDVAHLAAVYLRWVSFGLPAYAFNCISRRYFQSQGLFTVPTRIVCIVAPTNALLNYLLVWGPDPIRLGFIGAPIATAISFNLIAALSIAYGVLYTAHTGAWAPIHLARILKPASLGMIVRLGLSGVGQTASEWWAWELVALEASLLGPIALATQSVLLVSSSTTYQAPFALSVATAVRIGNLLGEAKPRRAGIAAQTSIVMVFGIACFTSAMFTIFRKQWGYIFNNDPEVIKLVASIMPLVALFQVFDGLSGVTGGVLRAQGKQFVGAVLNLSAYYIFGIPIGIYLAFSWKLGVHGLWLGLTFSLVYSAVIGTWICFNSNWEKEVRKVAARLKEEERVRVLEVESAGEVGEAGSLGGRDGEGERTKLLSADV